MALFTIINFLISLKVTFYINYQIIFALKYTGICDFIKKIKKIPEFPTYMRYDIESMKKKIKRYFYKFIYLKKKYI